MVDWRRRVVCDSCIVSCVVWWGLWLGLCVCLSVLAAGHGASIVSACSMSRPVSVGRLGVGWEFVLGVFSMSLVLLFLGVVVVWAGLSWCVGAGWELLVVRGV